MMVNRWTTEMLIEVPFYDLDPMKIVWHGNYLKYFEKVRCQLLEQIDYDYIKMGESGFMWPVIDVRVKYINSATFGQILRCSASIVEYENRLKISYVICCDKTGQRLTKGFTTQVAVDLNTKKLQLVSPPVLFEKLGVKNA